jgi:universal stress protein A
MKKYRHIMTATDFSPVSEIAAAQAIDLAKHYQAELSFLHVIEHFPEHLPHYKMAHVGKDPREFLTDRAEADLAKLCQKLGLADAKREVRLTTHSAKAEILEFVEAYDIDLIVIGARGQTGLIDRLAGSTATGVVRAVPCDVFVVHAER